MRIKHISFDSEMTTAVMHGVKRSWTKISSDISMLVVGVTQSTVDAYVQNVLKTPGICDNILPVAVADKGSAYKTLISRGMESVVHIVLLDDLAFTSEKHLRETFAYILKTLFSKKPHYVYIYGDKDVADNLFFAGLDTWLPTTQLNVGVENLLSNFSVPDFPDSEVLGTQKPDNIQTCSEFFIGDKFLSYTAHSILSLVDTIRNRSPKSNLRFVVSPKMARKLYRESMHY